VGSRAVVAFIQLGRPRFLVGGFVLYGLGAAIAAAAGHAIEMRRYLLGQGTVTAVQWMTHYANDYFDLDADRANVSPTRWSGGSRVLVSGELPPRLALHTALVLAVLATASAAALVAGGVGPLVVPTVLLVLALAWGYSAPPSRLCARGLGEATTALVVTVLVPWLGFYLQAPDARGGRWLALSIVTPALLQVAMLLAIEFSDASGDAATGKRTLVVRLGPALAARLYIALTAAAFAWLPIAYALGLPARVALAASTPFPAALWRIARAGEHRDAPARDRLAFAAVALLIATSAAELLAWLA
jgi:1,4-dihydroxy-2-naphthoate octaprenyltransferase